MKPETLVATHASPRCRALAVALLLAAGILTPPWRLAHAQAATQITPPQATQPSSASPASAVLAAAPPVAALSPLPAAASSPAALSKPVTVADADPVYRFLSDRGLLPQGSPVSGLAQQVRDRATDLASELVLSAMDFLGVRYKRGGNSRESGFDCSGFTRHVFENSVGLILPRRASEQAHSPSLVPVQKSELKPGDLVFFNTLRRTFSHVGIYIGDDKFIHSPRAGGEVRIEDMRQSYWQKRFDGARRAPSISAEHPGAAENN